MAVAEIKIAQDIAGAIRAREALEAALIEFQEACESRSWQLSEDARLRAVSNLEAHLDGLRSAYKGLELGLD